MKVALILKIDKKSENLIFSWKKKFKQRYKNILYLDDKPHVTLISTNIKKDKKKLLSFNKILFEKKKFKSKIIKSSVFWNDLLTNGSTFYFLISKSKKLLNLQKIFSNHIVDNFDLIKSRKKLKLNKIENKSYIKYGFPYVGLNWIPHLTIGSVLDKKLDHKFSNKFFSFKKKHSVIFIELVICEVINNKLREIQKIKL